MNQQNIVEDLPIKEVYSRVFIWYNEPENKNKLPESIHWVIKLLPKPSMASFEDMLFVFHLISSGPLEWAFKQCDKHGISMGDYARSVLNKEREKLGHDGIYEEYEKSSIFEELQRLRNKWEQVTFKFA